MLTLKQSIAGIILIALTFSALAGEDEIKKSFAENLPEAKLGAITKLPYGDLYQVVVNGINIMYTDGKGEVGLFGTMVKLNGKVNLTEQAKEKIIALDFSKLPLEKAFVRVKGTGARKMAIFSDPECPYCQLLEKELQGVTDVTIYTFLFPIQDIHPDALRKSQLIWCSKDKAQAWDDIVLNKKEPTDGDTKCETPIKEIAELAPKLWVTGTPGVIFSDGRLFAGALPKQRIEALLEEAPQSK